MEKDIKGKGRKKALSQPLDEWLKHPHDGTQRHEIRFLECDTKKNRDHEIHRIPANSRIFPSPHSQHKLPHAPEQWKELHLANKKWTTLGYTLATNKELQKPFYLLYRPPTTESQSDLQEPIAKTISHRKNAKKGLRGILIGSLTGASETVITYPLEYAKTQLQLDTGKLKSGIAHMLA